MPKLSLPLSTIIIAVTLGLLLWSAMAGMAYLAWLIAKAIVNA